MSDLFSNLRMVSRSLEAQRMGLDVVGQNLANVNTPGYTRRTLLLSSVPPADPQSAGGGVQVDGVRSTKDELLERRLRVEIPSEGRESAVADSLAVVEAALGKSGGSIDGALAGFFDAFSTLADDPTSATARQGVLIEGESVADAFNGMYERLQSAQSDADQRIRGAVDEVNSLVERIAGLNDSIARGGGKTSATLGLRDQLTAAVKDLSKYVDVSTIQRDDGGMDIALSGGQALVIGENAYKLGIGTDANGFTTLLSGGVDVTGSVTSGQIGGLLYSRDELIPQYMDRLDTMAYALATEVNDLHTDGMDLDGHAGLDFFTPLASSAGAARLLQLNPAMAGNPRLVAAGTSSPGDNQTARALGALRDARVIDAGTTTLSDAWGDLTYRVGQDSATAKAELENRTAIVQQIEALRDAVSGVSLDEEAMEMMKFQRAYEANARYFQTIDSALDTLMSMVGS